MWNFLVYLIPWWVWAIVLVLVLGVVAWYWRNLKVIIMLGVLAVFLYLLRGQRKDGYDDRVKEEADAINQLEKEYDRIKNKPVDSRDNIFKRLRDRNK